MTELVKTALESFVDSENQRTINAFSHASVQDVAGATVVFEVYHHYFASPHRITHLYNASQVQTLSAEDSGDVRSFFVSPVTDVVFDR